jgi:putative Mg2+ transporter-C (MgtC) family protein
VTFDVDLALQLSIVARLLGAAVLGALIGLEREIHEHPAGMRTHLLVSVGSAGFTVLSIEAFSAPGADPARVAAQIVTGVGFLGAGAILKEGATIRGLTTAASLWAVAAVGMAAGAGAWGAALAIAAIVVFSLWPLGRLTRRFVGKNDHRVFLRIASDDPHKLTHVVDLVTSQGGTIAHLTTSEPPTGGLVIETEVRVRDVESGVRLTSNIADHEELRLLESKAVGE